MSAICIRAPLAAGVIACLFTSIACAQAQAPARAPAAAGPWAKVPAFPTGCYQNVAANSPDPFYAKLEAAKTALGADSDRQAAINAQIKEDFDNIDPMEKAQRLQQWMMSNPQEAMAFMQPAQNAMVERQAEQQAFEQQVSANEAEWNALKQSYVDARLAAYAPLAARRKALAGRLGPAYGATTLAESWTKGYEDTGTSHADWGEAELINAESSRMYNALCPQWWGANGKFHAYLKNEKAWFMNERTSYLEKSDASKLQLYAIMNTPAASYRSTAAQQAAIEYLDLAYKVFGERNYTPGCEVARDCDGAYP